MKKVKGYNLSNNLSNKLSIIVMLFFCGVNFVKNTDKSEKIDIKERA